MMYNHVGCGPRCQALNSINIAAGPGAEPPVLQEGEIMGRVGLPELIIIVFIIILIFGANRLPDIGRGIGKAIKNFKEADRDTPDKQ